MAIAQRLYSDGMIDFSGGMDSNSSPSLLKGNQYVCSVNMQLKPGVRGISTRPGWREVKLNFKTKKLEKFYRSNVIQGGGAYLNKNLIIQLVSCAGYILEFAEVNKFEYDVKWVGIENNPNLSKAYFSNVPEGMIINDGEASPIVAESRSYRRTNRKEIGAGFGGQFIQNRFFYVRSDGKSIGVSSFNQPTSLEESKLNNFAGFQIPDNNLISAIGEQKHIRKDSQGGSLVMSSIRNIYSVDVSGPMSQWGQGSVGIVSGDVYDIGASSQYSFVSLNGNVYFRSRSLGLVSLQYLQYIFDSRDIIEPQSYGGDMFFNNDDQFLLENCYTVKYKNKLYTTCAPDVERTGVTWNGILVCKPGQKGVITYESVYTGIRPWCLIQPDDSYGEEYLYAHSFDYDGVNRMYILDENSDMDSVIGEEPKEIESKLFTRMMSFENGFALKNTDQQLYSISKMSRDVCVSILTRHQESASFKEIFRTTHKVDKCSVDKKGVFVNENLNYGHRDTVNFSDKSQGFQFKQDVIKILGSCNIDSLLRQCYIKQLDKTTHVQERIATREILCNEKIFSYKLTEA